MAKLIIASIVLLIILVADSANIPEKKWMNNYKFGNRVNGRNQTLAKFNNETSFYLKKIYQ